MDHLSTLGNLSLVSVVAFAGYASWRYTARKRSSTPHPPGPKGLPLIGNLLDMPTKHEWLAFNKYADQYGIQSLKAVPAPSKLILPF
jgi:hypothetical protein